MTCGKPEEQNRCILAVWQPDSVQLQVRHAFLPSFIRQRDDDLTLIISRIRIELFASECHIYVINASPEKFMNPINKRPRIDINVDRGPAAQINQPSVHVSPESSLPQSGPSSSTHGRQEAQPSRIESQRVVHTVDRMKALSPLSQLSRDEDVKVLDLLDRYAAGEPMDVLKKCQPAIYHYLNDDGLADTRAASRFVERIKPEERTKVQEAIKSRQLQKSMNPLLSTEGSQTREVYAKVLSLLGPYAAGKQIRELRKIFSGFSAYLSDKGLANTPSARNFFGQLSSKQKADVMMAIEKRQQKRTGNHPRLDSPARATPASGHDLEWVKSNIEPGSFRAAVEALTLTEHPEVSANIENVALYAGIPAESLQHLLQSEKRSDGTLQFQLTKLGEEYVNDQFPDEKEDILDTIALR